MDMSAPCATGCWCSGVAQVFRGSGGIGGGSGALVDLPLTTDPLLEDIRLDIRVVAPEESIVVIYNGIDREMFNIKDKNAARARLSLDGVGKRILFVGNLKPVKDVSNLIHAMRGIVEKRASVNLHIIGSGPLEHTLKQEARAMALEDSIHFEGEKDPKEIAVWMNACDLLCLPSLHEGVPNVILEALACGLPASCIST